MSDQALPSTHPAEPSRPAARSHTTDEVVLIEGYVPLLDMSGALAADGDARRALGTAIDAACRTSGFFLIAGHGVPQPLITAMINASLALFGLPAAERNALRCPDGDLTLRGIRTFHDAAPRRYARPLGGNIPAAPGPDPDPSVGASPPDLAELFTMNRLGEPGVAERAGLGEGHATWSRPNRWPPLAGFRDTWLAYYAEMERLAGELMRMFALGLGLDERYFDPLVDEHLSNLCANHYPPVTVAPAPGQFRKHPHTDSGTFTILCQDDAGGLQVVDRHSGDWVNVPCIPGTFVVNVGDLMAIWTNDEWVSTQHRILVPSPERWHLARVSLPFFHQPNWSTVIECLPSCHHDGRPPRHDPVASGEYLEYKVAGLAGTP